MSDVLLVVNILALLVLVIRFMQPQFLYWARRLVVDIRLSKYILDKERGRHVSQRAYIKLLVQDLRPEGVSSVKAITPRVNKVRALYNILDLRRLEVRDIPEAKNSQDCVAELANLLAALARHLKPNKDYDYGSIKANDVLYMIASRRYQEGGATDVLPGAGDEDAIKRHLEMYPLTLEQLNEIVIAAIYGALYRIPANEQIRRRLFINLKGIFHRSNV